MHHQLGTILRWVALLGVLMTTATPALAQAPPLTVMVSTSTSTPGSVTVGQSVANISLTASATGVPSDPYGTQAQLQSWAWSYTVKYGTTPGSSGNPPADATWDVAITSPPLTNPTTSTLTANFSQTGYWLVTPTATVRYTDNAGNNFTGTGTAAMPIVVTAVGVDKIQFQLPGRGFQDIPMEGLYVAAGTLVTFQAVPSPALATWPSGKPVWGGTCGATGSGGSVGVTLSSPSQSMTDTQTITAECGNTVSALIVRYGPDQGTLDIDWEDSQGARVVFQVSYQLWVPDIDGTGRPYAPGGYAALQSIDFSNLANLPDPPPLSDRAQWAFSNGVSYTQTVLAFTAELYQPWLHEYGPAVSSRRSPRSLYDVLEGERNDSAEVLGQAPPPPDPLDTAIAALVKRLGIPVPDAVIKELKDSFKKKNVEITPSGEEAVTTQIIISPTENKEAKMTVKADATQVRGVLAAKLGLKILMAANGRATATLDQFTILQKTYYSTPFVGIADVIKELGQVDGPKWPKPGNFYQEAVVNAGPSGINAERPKINRTGSVYGALNYATNAEPPVVFGKFGVTTAIKATDGLPLLYAVSGAYNVTNTALTGENDPAGQGQSVHPVSGQGVITWWAMRHNLNGGYTTDLLSKKLTINWK